MAKNIFLFALVVLFSISSVMAQGIEGVWFNTEKSGKIKIIKKGESYLGSIIWLEEPTNANGSTKTNENSKDESKHADPIIGLQVLEGFSDNGDGTFSGGTIYDPENGKTYKCKMTLQGDNLDVRGYIGIPAIGRTENWTRATN